MFECQHLFETIGKGRDANDSYIPADRCCHYDLFTDPSNRSELLSVVPVISNIFASLNIKEGYITGIGGYHDNSILRTKFHASDLNLFPDVYSSNNLKRLLSLSTNSNLIVKTIGDEDICFGLGVLGC